MLDPSSVPPTAALEFGIGRVIGRTLGIVIGNLRAFLVITVVVTLPVLVGGALVAVLLSGVAEAEPIGLLAGAGNGRPLVGGAVMGVAAVLAGMLLIPSLVYAAFEALRGGRAPIRASLRHGLARVLPVLATAAVTLLLFFLVQAPLMFIVLAVVGSAVDSGLWLGVAVAAVIAYLAFIAWVLAGCWVLVPVAVVERAGIVTTLGRTWQLTRGLRWHAVAIVVLSLAGAGAAFALFGMLGLAGREAEAAGLPGPLLGALAALVGGGMGFAIFAYFAVLPSVGYYYLKRAKEGVEIDELFAVFD